MVLVSWIWQAGGLASRSTPVVNPADAKGMKIRGGSREMDMMFQAAGATTLNTPSNELYAAMQTGACDACTTSSTSLISFRLEEVSKSITTGRGKSYWYMLEPLVMSKQVFDSLSKKQQDVILALGAEMEAFGTTEAEADDKKVADVYAKKGAKVLDMDEAIVDKWRAIARDTAWKDYAKRSALAAELIKLAEGVTPDVDCGDTGYSMSHGLDPVETAGRGRPSWTPLAPASSRGSIALIVILSSIALVLASCVLTYSVIVRYFLKISTEWQDEMSVFLIVGAVFMSSGAIQSQRGHIGIEAIVGLLPERVNHCADLLVDVASLAFCGYFAWKSATLLQEAGRTTTTRPRPGPRRCGFPTR